jgi:hypothetical protein
MLILSVYVKAHGHKPLPITHNTVEVTVAVCVEKYRRSHRSKLHILEHIAVFVPLDLHESRFRGVSNIHNGGEMALGVPNDQIPIAVMIQIHKSR